jgi:hypothetical protein
MEQLLYLITHGIMLLSVSTIVICAYGDRNVWESKKHYGETRKSSMKRFYKRFKGGGRQSVGRLHIPCLGSPN